MECTNTESNVTKEEMVNCMLDLAESDQITKLDLAAYATFNCLYRLFLYRTSSMPQEIVSMLVVSQIAKLSEEKQNIMKEGTLRITDILSEMFKQYSNNSES